MRRALRLAVVVAALRLAGCSVTYPEGVLACTTRDECPSGWTCRASRCYSTAALDAGTDAGTDATIRDDGGTADAAPVDLGCPATGPTNADCPWHFGRPHAVPSLHASIGEQWGAAVAADGLTVYVATEDATAASHPIHRAVRMSASSSFGALLPVLGTTIDGIAPIVLTVTADELEIFAQVSDTRAGAARSRILRYARSSTSAPFTAPEPIEALEVLGMTVHPSVTGDGLELFFTRASDRRVYRTQRDSRAAPFGEATPVGFASGLQFARVTPDGLGLFVSAPAQYTTRPDRRSAFGALAALPNASALGAYGLPTYVPATRELWYASGVDGMQAPWSAATRSLWRVQVCRNGPCAAEPAATACPAPSQESPDGFHCYFASTGAPFVWGSAEDACGAGFRLASVHSREELRVATIAGGTTDHWLGASDLATEGTYVWTSGEPFVYASWGSGEPDMVGGNNCIAVIRGAFNDTACGTLLNSVCEQSIWPTW